MKPGLTTRPAQSIVSSSLPSRRTSPSRPTASTTPPERSTSPTSSSCCDGSRMRPPRSRIIGALIGRLGLAAREEIEHRHAYGHAVRHLVEDHAVRTVGDVGVDLDAAVHRARVKDEQVLRRALESLARDAEDAVVLAQRGNVARLHALELETQD